MMGYEYYFFYRSISYNDSRIWLRIALPLTESLYFIIIFFPHGSSFLATAVNCNPKNNKILKVSNLDLVSGL